MKSGVVKDEQRMKDGYPDKVWNNPGWENE
jgi:hypothetical protein